MYIRCFVRYGIMVAAIAGSGSAGRAADWPQYMRDACHTADAGDQRLTLPLHVAASVRLDDAVLTSPAVVANRVYVVDQMGSAYCIDPKQASVVWKVDPPGASAVGGNTSSPCVVGRKMAYGTTAGRFFLLDVKNGDVVKMVAMHQAILGAITAANDRFYLQTLDGVIRCLDAEGELCWRFDPYADAPGDPGSREKRQYSRGEVAVFGDRVVAAAGFDLVCLRDKGNAAEPNWIARKAITDTYLPVGVSLADGWVYAAYPGKDGKGAIVRFHLETGAMDRDRDVVDDQWAIVTPPATRNGVAYYCRQAFGLTAARLGAGANVSWSSFGELPESMNPASAAPSLAGDHCIFTLLSGGLAISPLPGEKERVNSAGHIAPQVIKTLSGAAITSSPAISDGVVYFGSDDGHLYILRSERNDAAVNAANVVSKRRSETQPAGALRYAWPSAFGGPANTNFIEDPSVRPPFRLRWAANSGGLFKQALCATEEDLVYVTLGGLVVCREQMTGRIRWRRHLPGQTWCRSALLVADGKVFVPRMFSLRYPKSLGAPSTLYCLSGESGEIEWQAPIGIGDRLRASPVYCDGVVAFGSLYREGPPPTFFAGDEAIDQAIDAWDAATGKPLWQAKFKSRGKFLNGPAGCAGDGVYYFTGGGEGPRDGGETVAIDPKSGRVLWRSAAFASQTGAPSYQAGLLYLPGTYHRPVTCLNAKSGETVWTNDLSVNRWHVDTVALGPDYFAINNKYEGGCWRWDARTGEPVKRDGKPLQIWGPAHACGAIVLTASGHALSATIGGLCMTDVNTGELAWNTPGFGSYTCPHAIASNGRIFYAPQTSGMLFCYEPCSADEAHQ